MLAVDMYLSLEEAAFAWTEIVITTPFVFHFFNSKSFFFILSLDITKISTIIHHNVKQFYHYISIEI